MINAVERFKTNKKYDANDILRDLHGNAFKFYRGKNIYNISKRAFFCNCFDIAKSFSLEGIVFECEIRLKNPVIIDATCDGGYCYYDTLHVQQGKFYPESMRKELLKYMENEHMRDTISADEIGVWASSYKSFDGVIIKNVREGIQQDVPIYDVIVWDWDNLVDYHNVTMELENILTFRQATFKRVDLSRFIKEDNCQDGIISISYYDDYCIEHRIVGNGEYYVDNVLIIQNVDNKAIIYCEDISDYVTGVMEEEGKYSYAVSFGERQMTSKHGVLELSGINNVFRKFQIERI